MESKETCGACCGIERHGAYKDTPNNLDNRLSSSNHEILHSASKER